MHMSYLPLLPLSDPGPPPYIWKPPTPPPDMGPMPKPGVMGGESKGDSPKYIPPPPPPRLIDAGPRILDGMGTLLPMGPKPIGLPGYPGKKPPTPTPPMSALGLPVDVRICLRSVIGAYPWLKASSLTEIADGRIKKSYANQSAPLLIR